MKQIIQDLKSGDTILEEVPVPRVGSGKVLIKTHRTLVSLGTEKMLVSFGQANLLDKARSQPEKVKQVIDKMKTDGIQPTLEAVFRKLGTPLPLGYSQAGEVVEVGKGVTEFSPGDRVVSNGNHAEYVAVPKNLVAKIPEGVSYEEASFTVVGAIGLQGIRLVQPTLGETVAVIGLGLIGLITAQLLKANGCKVVGFDLDEDKLKRAESYGITAVNSGKQDPVRFMEEFTGQVGADAVIITASTKSNDVIKQSANMSRKRGRIVLVGVVGLDIDRADFYEKELSFQVSCSYGPGRYDEEYEQRGNDYPLPFVRWTEKRNFEAILEAIRNGSLDVQSLITERVKLEDYLEIYGDMGRGNSIASILEYPGSNIEQGTSNIQRRTISISSPSYKSSKGTIAIVGAGNFTQAMILPALDKVGASMKYVVSSGGLSSTTLAKKYKIPNSTTDLDAVLSDEEVDGVVITTQHNLHAGMTIQSLRAGKQVFVEKPLALKPEELDEIISSVEETGSTVTVGFNRRFSPHAEKMRALIGERPGPMNVIATMNAGHIPPDVWVHDLESGGGRIVGEACHYVDLITYLTGSKVMEVSMQAMGTDPKENTDNASIHLKYENGSLGVINYFANGNKSYSKERVEVYYQGNNLILDNFRRLDGYGFGGGFTSKILKTKQDKGHHKQFELLTKRWKEGGEPLIPFDEIVNTTKATFAAIESLKQGKPVRI
ncbi:MAG: dehydrogenase [Balneola sp.]|jgi:predicted dehydrogenase|nr:dehydrogenase [Balneola sp.]MBE80533.1 dehydrogenase [Balneola sp.]HBX65484.1 dehydrogenase [Balneolaceae bacterium]|tara:strand:- start:117440 stop:119584 length:2145 start_codon:yes stop_codon:yes gene_type:complete